SLVQFASTRTTQGLVAHARISVIRYLSTPMWLWQIKTCKGVIFSQGVRCPVTRHHNTAQVGMIAKSYAKEVIDLSLIPIRTRPDARYRRNTRLLLTTLPHTHLQ